jgi:hypothetical protein
VILESSNGIKVGIIGLAEREWYGKLGCLAACADICPGWILSMPFLRT